MKALLHDYLNRKARAVNGALKRCLPGGNDILARAMRYSVLAGGKRLRPVLVIAGAELCGGKEDLVMPAACAVEFVHTYSLIHDDLPAMDNDDLRRGMPTSHKKYGEACAILAGDALLTDAFRLMALCGKDRRLESKNVVRALELLSVVAGYQGMVGGQAHDTIETGTWQKKSSSAAAKKLNHIHLNKTAALIRGSLMIGAVLAGASEKRIQYLDNYGRNIGLAFQVADDILDVTANKNLLGKRGSDRDNNKLTYVSLFGIDKARAIASEMVREAKMNLLVFRENGEMLSQLADYIIERKF